MKNTLLIAVIVAAFSATPAHAQFSKLLGNKQSVAPASGNAAPTGDSLVNGYQAVSGHMVNSQLALAESLGLKDQMALLQAEQKSIAAGQTDTDAMKKTRSVTDETSKLILAKLEAQPKLEGQARGKFTEGLLEYLKAAVSTKQLIGVAQQWGSGGITSLGALAGKGKAAMWVAKETPGLAKGVATTTRALLAYAKRNDIQAPANATASLDAL